MPKSYRIRTQVGVDKYINLNLEQDWEQLEILSLKILANDIYTRFCSDYGVVVGRVFVNGGYGLPNAKVSVFIPLEAADEINPVIAELYPYKTITDTNEDGYRYNLLPKLPSYKGHQSTGSFPNKGDVLMDSSYIEVFDKYYRFTVETNESGDFMIFGVPVGTQTIVMDVDLSDIGCFSLSPQDLIQQGLATESQVDGATFKTSTNLRELPQLKNLVFDVNVAPFWGETDLCQVGITRVDFDLTKQANITIQPTAVFMGSIISTTDDDSLKVNCKPKNDTGNLCELIAGPGEVLSIRQTINSDSQGLPILEQYSFDGGSKIIDGDGTFLTNVPMNLDYIYTNEFGEQVYSNDPKKGIPTKGKYRFKFKWQNEEGLQGSFLRGNFLVPNVKEHGWSNSYDDPFDPTLIGVYNYPQIPVGTTSGSTVIFLNSEGLSNPQTTNVESYQIYINGQIYVGSLNSIILNAGDSIKIIATPIDPLQPQDISFTSIPQQLFELFKSYAFSLDWDDYANIQDAINCEDTFYEFRYNKVYTTAMFLDRYKKGIGRAKHLGIKEIDNRSCKSTVNTFPVNDIIRNFDYIFFVFNLLLNVLAWPLMSLIFLIHIVAAIWELIRKIVNAIKNIFKIDIPDIPGFPRIGLPMIAYPDCTSCECDCGINQDENVGSEEQGNTNYDNGAGSLPYTVTLTTLNTLIAPVNIANLYEITHPNLLKLADGSQPYDCGPGYGGNYDSFETLIDNNHISLDVAVQANLDLKRVISGYDVISSDNPNRLYNNELYLLHAPQPFLWSGEKKNIGADRRYFAFPLTETYPQKLNEFNTRDKYFSGENIITTWVNPSLNSNPANSTFTDQVLVVLMNSGTASTLGVGNICSFQNPNYTDSGSINRMVNLTGATTNQFNNNAITGTTLTGQTSIVVNYANQSDPNGQTNSQKNILINIPQVSQLPVNGNPSVEQDYLKYNTDIEYYQLITGMTVSDFENMSLGTSGYYNSEYLFHNIQIAVPDCDVVNYNPSYSSWTITDVLKLLPGYETFEVCVFTRGVDPHTAKQTIRYDLSTIFGYTTPNNVEVEGSYYLNIPIQAYPSGDKPRSHNSVSNNDNYLYFPSYGFNITSSNYIPFTSNLPYYYLSTDDAISTSYNPAPFLNWQTAGSLIQSTGFLYNTTYTQPTNNSGYVGGGSFAGWSNNNTFNYSLYTDSGGGCNNLCQVSEYYASQSTNNDFGLNSAGGVLSSLYSSAYYRFSLTPINFSNSSRIVMRSDRIPTSNGIENGGNNRTAYGLHQNNNFSLYTDIGLAPVPTIYAGGDPGLGGDNQDSNDFISGLTETLTCEGMVPLACYSGSGINVGVLPSGQCSVPEDRMINGCYCLINKPYIVQVLDDIRLFLEWKVRFTMNLAACRGIFAQVFQNNWVNGTLYMFSFNKRNSFSLNPNSPAYKYCTDVLIFNSLTNNFYYRSSPWNGSDFIGKDSPTPPQNTPLLPGYNKKQIQFPTTIVDLGPRDYFINEICCSGSDSGGFGSYYGDQLKSTSYQDNTDIIQLGFLSRLLNEGTRNRMLPINVGQSSGEGVGVIQFFNSDRGGSRIDGDWAQMLSINSEWKVLPFITENIPSNQYIYFGDNGASTPKDVRPIMGLFFQTPENNLRYRKIESPGTETYSFTPLIEENFGYAKSQVVPNYKWSIKPSAPTNVNAQNIFGNEDNNWYTDTVGSDYNGGFFKKQYQSLDFVSVNEKYRTQTTKLGYLTNYDLAGNPVPQPAGGIVLDGEDSGLPDDAVVVGAPYHFYFGLNNGKTAINRFYKLYVQTEQE
jgi:hypothetical protein